MNHLGSPRGHPRFRSAARALVATTAVLAAVAVVALPAAAAPASNSQAVAVTSGQEALGGFLLPGPFVFPAPLPIVVTNLTVTANATWSGSITGNVGWDTDDVRQGADLDVSRVSPLTSGEIDVTWQVSGTVDGIFNFGPTNVSKDDVSCVPKLSGGGFSCSGTSGGIPLPGAIGPIPAIPPFFFVAKLAIGVAFDVTPEGAVVTRGFTVGGNPVAGPDDLSLTDGPQVETFAMPCTAQAGDAVDYGLDPFHWTPATTATQQTKIRIVTALDPLGAVELFDVTSFDIGPAQVSSPDFDLAGSGFLTALGPLLANNINPTIDPLGPFSGSEGSPIAFSASVDSQCPIGSYVWEFSNGTKSFGPSPVRAFGDDAVYDGQLTVTDITGLSATRDFTVSVSNVEPSVNAGPDTTADWGRPVSFNGQATDPGSDDQSTLQYTWTFGDGTPSASGGPSVLHEYAMPGPYVATLEVCDKDGACDSDSRTVVVTRRETTLAYTGPLTSNPSKTITLSADLVDEYGEAVPGKKVDFVLGSQTAFATTNSSGHAAVSIKLNQKQGSYSLTAIFAPGDVKYFDSADSGTFVIGK